jgi:hypothetical protein
LVDKVQSYSSSFRTINGNKTETAVDRRIAKDVFLKVHRIGLDRVGVAWYVGSDTQDVGIYENAVFAKTLGGQLGAASDGIFDSSVKTVLLRASHQSNAKQSSEFALTAQEGRSANFV